MDPIVNLCTPTYMSHTQTHKHTYIHTHQVGDKITSKERDFR